MAEIDLHQRGSVCRVTLVDDEDYAALAAYRWSLNSNGYAVRMSPVGGMLKAFLLHRVLLGLVHGDGLEGDHINGDKLDNRRSNLRIVTHAQQTQNVRVRATARSRFRNVYWERGKGQSGKWRVRPRVDGVYYHLGYYTNELEAALVAERWRRENMPYAQPDPELLPFLSR